VGNRTDRVVSSGRWPQECPECGWPDGNQDFDEFVCPLDFCSCRFDVKDSLLAILSHVHIFGWLLQLRTGAERERTEEDNDLVITFSSRSDQTTLTGDGDMLHTVGGRRSASRISRDRRTEEEEVRERGRRVRYAARQTRQPLPGLLAYIEHRCSAVNSNHRTPPLHGKSSPPPFFDPLLSFVLSCLCIDRSSRQPVNWVPSIIHPSIRRDPIEYFPQRKRAYLST
jgi:hypothetical protein